MRKLLVAFAALALVRIVMMSFAPVFDPSEARYAAISANMSRTGDFVVPHFTYKGTYQSFDGKPPLVFQAGGVFCSVLGVNEFAVRLFPFLSALLVLYIVYHAVRRTDGGERAALAVAVCATSTAFYIASGISMTDMTLTCAVAGALLVYGRSELSAAARVVIGALLGVGMMTKGPVAMVMFGLPVLADCAVNRNWRKLFDWRWLVLALPTFLAISLPWFFLVEARNPGSVWYFFYNENFMRFVSHDYGDRYGAGREAFRGVSVLWAFVSCLPWGLLPFWRFYRRVRGIEPLWRLAGWRSFEFVAILAITAFWCLTSRVLVYYLFPVIPLFAVWIARNEKPDFLRRFVWPAAVIAMVAVVVMFAGGMLLSDKMQGSKTPFSRRGSTYAYEFYHGTHPDALKDGLERR